MEPKKIFIAATRQNDGKTVVCLGLLLVLKEIFKHVGFMKPVGQKYILVDGGKIDKDAILMKKVCNLKDDLSDINPISVEEGFTQKYLDSPHKEKLVSSIIQSYERISKGKEVVVIEGTGHAGVGSVFDICNAEVAKILAAPVIIISIGGIGKPIDEISLNKALFEQKQTVVKGTIINKVLPEKKATIEKYLEKGLKKFNMKLLGILPFIQTLSQPTINQICECINGKILAGHEKVFRQIKHIIVGAMTPRHALDYFKPNSLLVTPGDREDLILAALSYSKIAESSCEMISGIVLTGGLYPHKTILDLIKKQDLPTVLAPYGTYEVASSIHALVAKIREEDTEKIEIAKNIVKDNIKIEEVLN